MFNLFQTEEQKLNSILSVFTKAKEELANHAVAVADAFVKQGIVVQQEQAKLDALITHNTKLYKIKAQLDSFLGE